MIRFILLMGVFGAPLLSLPAEGQTPGAADFSNIVGHEKRPHHDTVQTAKPLPPAESKRLSGKLRQIRDLIVATPTLSNLRGHDWETFTIVKDAPEPGRPVVASVTYIPFAYFKDPRSGKPISSEEGPHFAIHVNDPEIILGGLYTVDQEARFAPEPRPVGELGGFPVFAGQFVVLSKRGQPVFTPVTQERYLNRLIEKSRLELKDLGARFKDVPEDPAANKREIDGRTAGLKAARAEQEQRWAVMAPKWPDRVAAERAKFDAKEKKQLQEIEDLKSGSPRQRFMRPFEARQKELEAELASLSPAERSAPAYLPRSPNKDRPSGLAAKGSTDGTRIVTINPGLFDAKKPKSEIQLLILGTTQYSQKLYDPVQQQIDKAALLGLID
ncbi:hypothetical protein [Hyalangium versicolor]|uniref:hypothetical protein n=1 Tax=Hyalangium versicolor TaxID=2861190 RepID=UPI001CC909D8|nr:hypothetical protein [Hyalangium versicolor]